MAMTMTGEVQLPASREVVWAKLNDPEVLKACIPGCEELNEGMHPGLRGAQQDFGHRIPGGCDDQNWPSESAL